ncbi:MAG: hypothetical protein ACR2HJ_03440 [Fimbriimonadales bacterium]
MDSVLTNYPKLASREYADRVPAAKIGKEPLWGGGRHQGCDECYSAEFIDRLSHNRFHPDGLPLADSYLTIPTGHCKSEPALELVGKHLGSYKALEITD